MAQLKFVRKFTDRRKKMAYVKMKARQYIFKLSLTTNLVIALLYAEKYGYLTNIKQIYLEKVAPILESLINNLPL